MNDFPKKIFVTGASGLIGTALVNLLLAKDVVIHALVKENDLVPSSFSTNKIKYFYGDICDEEVIGNATEGCDAVIHLAALNKLYYKNTGEFYRVNSNGTAQVCKAALINKIKKFIYMSSCEVMGPAVKDLCKNENYQPLAQDIHGGYEKSKFVAEEIVKSFVSKGLQCAIIRPTAVFGPNDKYLTPPGRLLRAYIGKEIPIYFDAGINIIDSRDVAKICMQILSEFKCETYIAAGHNIMLSQLFDRLSILSGKPKPKVKIPYNIAYLATLLLTIKSKILGTEIGVTKEALETVKFPWFFDNSKIVSDLGFKPKQLDETISDCLRWHLDQIKSEEK